MNRDPKSQAKMAVAVHKWRRDMTDTADIDFERAMLDQGVIRPDDSVESIGGGNGSIFVILEGGESFRIDLDGNVCEE